MKIFRISSILSLLVAVIFGVLLFWTSQAVQVKENRLEEAKKELAHETQTLRVLAVEWDYLNRPQRLEVLANELLGMQAPTSDELLKDVSAIPEPSQDINVVQDGGKTYSISHVPAQEQITNTTTPSPPMKSPKQAEKDDFDRLIERLDRTAPKDVP